MHPGTVEVRYLPPEKVGVLLQHGNYIFDLSERLAPLSQKQKILGQDDALAS
jgi:hypothetical protein